MALFGPISIGLYLALVLPMSKMLNLLRSVTVTITDLVRQVAILNTAKSTINRHAENVFTVPMSNDHSILNYGNLMSEKRGKKI